MLDLTALIRLRTDLAGVLHDPLTPRVIPPPLDAGQVHCQRCGTPRYPAQNCRGCSGRHPTISAAHRMAIGATKRGITVDEYRAHAEADELWCSGHRAWEPSEAFVPASRRAGAKCREANIEYQRRRRAEQKGA